LYCFVICKDDNCIDLAVFCDSSHQKRINVRAHRILVERVGSWKRIITIQVEKGYMMTLIDQRSTGTFSDH